MNPRILLLAIALASAASPAPAEPPKPARNPVFPGWYADPEAVIFGKEYWIYPTFSAGYDEQLHFDAFSSQDLVTWKKHERILDHKSITWARRAMWAMWAPAAIEKDVDDQGLIKPVTITFEGVGRHPLK
jgi:hypothetical protein